MRWDWIPLGHKPGEEPSGEGFFVFGAAVAILVGVGYCVFAAARARSSVWPDPLIPVAAAAFVVAGFYSFDAYYLPTHRRFSDSGSVTDAWVSAWSPARLSSPPSSGSGPV